MKLCELPRHQDLRRLTKATIIDTVQCPFGARTTRPTILMVLGCKVPELPARCPHSPRKWIMPWYGEFFFQPRPPLIGTQWAIKDEDWNKTMLRKRAPKGPFISKAAAWYPLEFNPMLLRTLTIKHCRRLPARQAVVSLAPASGDTAGASAGPATSSCDKREGLKIDYFNAARPFELSQHLANPPMNKT